MRGKYAFSALLLSLMVATGAAVAQLMPILEAHAGDYKACMKSASPTKQDIRNQIRALEQQEPKTGSGPQVRVGSCAARLKKLDGNFLCCKTFLNTAENWEQRSCLQLKLFYLDKLCECGAQGRTYSSDEALQDQTLEAYSLAVKIKNKLLSKGIKNSVIKEYVKRMSAAVDCINAQSIEILQDTMHKLEEIDLANP